jgi:hypothetical protein
MCAEMQATKLENPMDVNRCKGNIEGEKYAAWCAGRHVETIFLVMVALNSRKHLLVELRLVAG